MQPPQLAEQPDRPEGLAYLWEWFCELRAPVSYTELDAWSRLTRRQLSAWEVDQLIALDRLRNTP